MPGVGRVEWAGGSYPQLGRRSRHFAVGSFLALAALAHGVACAPKAGMGLRGDAPDRGGELRLTQEAPVSLDPVDVESVYDALPVNQLFDGLVDVDGARGVMPSLARAWTVSRDGRTYSFRLRAGVRFHDGTALTADDVVFTFRRVLAPEHCKRTVACDYVGIVSGAADYTAGRTDALPGVFATDALTVGIVLDRPYPSFLEVLAMDGLRIVPRVAFGRVGRAGFRRAPIGTGPFRLSSWDRDGMRLVANRDHFAGAPMLDAVDIRFRGASEEEEDSARFRRGEIDALELSPASAESFSGEPNIRVVRYPEMGLTFLGLDTTATHLRDARVRRALTHALDRAQIAEAAGVGPRPATGILPPGLTGYLPEAKALAFDPGLARRLLSEAGYPGGRGLPPLDVFMSGKTASTRAVFRGVERDLAAVGIRARAREVPWEELNRMLDARSAPIFALTWIADLSDPDSFLRTLFRAGGASNFTGIADAEIDRLLDLGAAERDPVLRSRIYARAEQRLLDLAPVIPLYHTIGILALHSRVHGLEPGAFGLGNAALENVWIERRRAA